MHIVKADIQKNRLYIKLTGFLRASEAAEFKIDVINEISPLVPGFDVVDDTTDLHICLGETELALVESVDFMIEKGVNRIVRVVGTARSGQLRMLRFTKKSDKYITHFVPSLEDAEELLNKKN